VTPHFYLPPGLQLTSLELRVLFIAPFIFQIKVDIIFCFFKSEPGVLKTRAYGSISSTSSPVSCVITEFVCIVGKFKRHL
jgi:hypothetical protein